MLAFTVTLDLRRWGRFAPRFLALGYDVLMPDAQRYGKSRGASSEGSIDLRCGVVVRSLPLEQWKDKDIVIYGRSLGSALAKPVAAQRAPRLLLLETPFANLIDVARYYLPILPTGVLLRYRSQRHGHGAGAVPDLHLPRQARHGGALRECPTALRAHTIHGAARTVHLPLRSTTATWSSFTIPARAAARSASQGG